MSSTRYKYVDVALAIPGSQPFTYLIPENFGDFIQVGMRVKVSVARKEMVGWVVRFRTETQVAVKPVIELLDAQPCLDEQMLDLTAWIAEYYHCSWGEAIKSALPPSMIFKPHPVISMGSKAGQVPVEAANLFLELKEKGPVSEKNALRLLGKNQQALLKSLINAGLLQRIVTLGKPGTYKHQRWLVFSKTGQLPSRAVGQKKLLDDLEKEKELPSGSIISLSAANELVRKGMAKWELRPIRRVPKNLGWEDKSIVVELNQNQKQAREKIAADLRAEVFRVNLIHGVTGSGKTELYLRTAEDAIKIGKSVLILVPEIGLTVQMISRVKRCFPDAVVWHSGLNPGERIDAWESIKRGEVKVVVGTRSAVFAPLSNLGLIVIDEEQDASYKQSDARPYYNARDVSIIRARYAGASVILGSATPSVESYYKAVTGKFRLFSWDRRAGQSILPQVRVIDTKQNKTRGGLISPELREALQQTVESGQQAMLLLNRRGHSPYVQCRACGHIIRCLNCSISLTYHRTEEKLLCHYCGYTRKPYDICPVCQKPDLFVAGTAIQGLEEELKRLYPGIGILRMDADTTSSKGGHQRILSKFHNNEAQILIGTQMISKGHDFPNVTLVSIINTDDLLGIPDFRSQERAFNLITQMAGRSGRGTLQGQVLLHTRDPMNPVIVMAQNHDYQGFWRQEIKERKDHGYPPFTRLALIIITAGETSLGEEQALLLASAISRVPATVVMGPAPAPVFKAKGRYRWHILIKAKDQKTLADCLKLIPGCIRSKKLRLVVDVDPISIT